MRLPTELYRPSLALLTDLYELTMACAYWKAGIAEREAVFHLTFRSNPFGGGFTLACGLQWALTYLLDLHFEAEDLAYLADQRGSDGKPLFDPAFLDRLGELHMTCDVDAVPEGTVVFPHEPLVRVKGPILQAQLLETPLLNLIGFPTLVATKAARVKLAARGGAVLEFGLRRAQGIDGGLCASRAAFIGGCDATSNVLAGRLFDIPVKGTHAHSWVMLFDNETAAFEAYAAALPNNCVFLVDTYDSLQGVRHAIEVGRQLRRDGQELLGIRLDSGDLAYLSIQARRMLDLAGFDQALIFASNNLDERTISSLKEQGAAIDVWGVGTHLVTAFGQPALGVVYKLSAVRGSRRGWEYKLKLSEEASKISTPGILQIRRFEREGEYVADMIYDELLGAGLSLVDPIDVTRRKGVAADTAFSDLLVPVLRGGKAAYPVPALVEMRERAAEQLSRLHPGIKRFMNPHRYPAGLEQRLHDLKMRLVLEAKRG
jgi:nicotinate phosphoribosyltransferase